MLSKRLQKKYQSLPGFTGSNDKNLWVLFRIYQLPNPLRKPPKYQRVYNTD